MKPAKECEDNISELCNSYLLALIGHTVQCPSLSARTIIPLLYADTVYQQMTPMNRITEHPPFQVEQAVPRRIRNKGNKFRRGQKGVSFIHLSAK